MKKSMITFLLVIAFGIFCGKYTYEKLSVYAFDNIKNNMVYLLQIGVYLDKDTLEADTNKINNKIVIHKDNNYYVYVGVSKSLDNLKKISNIYKKYGYNLYLKEEYINSSKFLSNIDEFDILLKDAKTIDEINAINSVILSNYEKNVLKV